MPAPKNAPLYQQIYDEIKDAIEKGVYAPKERIPSELELAEQYEVSRITVRRAVEELCSDGYLVKQQGRGTLFPRRTSIVSSMPRRCRRLPRCVPITA